MKKRTILGLMVSILCICHSLQAQNATNNVVKDSVVINQRFIEIYNNLVQSQEPVNSVNFFIDNYTFDDVVILVNSDKRNELFNINKVEVDAYLLSQRPKSEPLKKDEPLVASKTQRKI